MTETPRPVGTVRHVMAARGVSRRTVYYWIAGGRVDVARAGENGLSGVRIFLDRLPTRQNQGPKRAQQKES